MSEVGRIDGFVFIPIDTRLLTAVKRVGESEHYKPEDFNLTKKVHEYLWGCLYGDMDERFGMDGHDFKEWEELYPNEKVFEYLPDIDRIWNSKSEVLEDVPKMQ